MIKLIPWDAGDPNRKYVKSESTDIRKTFRSVRKKQLRALELKRRKEIAAMKKGVK